MSIFDFLFGKPLATGEERAERIGTAAGIPIFGLDALSSAAYGPEAAMTLLIPLGLMGVSYIIPISLSIIVLLTIVYFSYRQTIDAYPGGGGSYTVAKENLGQSAGLLAAAALMIDYILVVAVGISAGVGALVSAAPGLQPHTLALCLGILVIITLINLRGVRETGGIFMIPTYLFVGTLVAAILIGALKTILSGGNPVPVVTPPRLPQATAGVGAWLLLKVFSSGCTAMTGVEAVSNGVQAFREPASKYAQRTLTVIIALLIVLLGGIAWLVSAYGIGATDPGKPGYENVLSELVGAVAGKGIFYYLTMGSVLLVLALSANTAFADFPRLCRTIAHDDYLPHSLMTRGRRLVYSEGIYALGFFSAVLLIVFGGVTDRLIPLFAVGAFLAFSLSQFGMVVHWKKQKGGGAWQSMLVNGLGATATGITVLVVLVAKFAEGAWITLLLIPGLLLLMIRVRSHYNRVAKEIGCETALELDKFAPPMVVVPVEHWSRISKKAMRFALTISPDVTGLHVGCEGDENLRHEWEQYVEKPALQVGLPSPKLVTISSPYRFIINPILDYVLELERKNPGRQVAVTIPELVERRWYYYFLHNQRAAVLKTLLYVRGSERVIVINVPWYFE